MAWGAQRAEKIAKYWMRQLVAHHSKDPSLRERLTFRLGLEAGKSFAYDRVSRLIQVQFLNPETKLARGQSQYGAVILTFGHGREKNRLSKSTPFVGYPFWESDTFESLTSGVGSPDKVLISGAGDGAAQDLLRIVTRKKSAREIFLSLGIDPITVNWSNLLSAEYKAERAMTWNSGAASVPYWIELHKATDALVDSLLPSLQPKIRELIQDSPITTTLVTKPDFLTCVYPLNRFLALLLLKYDPSRFQWLPGKTIVDIKSYDPSPESESPKDCMGVNWRVELKSEREGITMYQDANVVILRHGLEVEEDASELSPTLPVLPRLLPPIHLLK